MFEPLLLFVLSVCPRYTSRRYLRQRTLVCCKMMNVLFQFMKINLIALGKFSSFMETHLTWCETEKSCQDKIQVDAKLGNKTHLAF